MKKFNKKFEAENLMGDGCDLDSNPAPEAIDNKIYFYCPVDNNNIFEFNKKLREMDKRNYIDALSYANSYDDECAIIYKPIVIYINSDGGDVSSGLSAMDTIIKCKSPIYTVIDGMACSAATLISIVGTKRFMTPHSSALIHQLSSKVWGTYENIRDEMANCDMLMNMAREIYIKYTKLTGEQLIELMKHDLLLNATKCLEYGVVDAIK
jgi:ATP-dependent Clp protease protease subunit